ncbi:MAG: HupE/UreJ family protein [Flavobacteriaceae bacterium]|nr:HupE/UreJ family protein [Flavobacteriaceae bacterium]
MKTKVLFFLMLFIYGNSFAHGISEADKSLMLSGSFAQYISLGASHMITGYDHLLFLFGVIFFLVQFKDIVKFITIFTIGHSITLIFATFMGITANYFLIDALIALTVIYKGFDNLDGFRKCFDIKAPNLLVLVFIFGLVHGFGLSTRLQQLPLGTDGLLAKIIAFNVGVELGQISALLIMLIVLSKWRQTESFRKFSKLANTGLIVAGVILFFMQMHGYSHDLFVDELAFSKDAHNHAHMNKTSPKSLPLKEVSLSEDIVTLIIAGGKSIEYKFDIKKGQSLEYSWKTNHGRLFYDFHGEPKGDKTGYFETFEKNTKSSATGKFKAPFEGSHGWYWKNSGIESVKLTLKTKGNYNIIGIR